MREREAEERSYARAMDKSSSRRSECKHVIATAAAISGLRGRAGRRCDEPAKDSKSKIYVSVKMICTKDLVSALGGGAVRSQRAGMAQESCGRL
uniref:Uncharacterized protein n=1 Tax=Peronospora matthiolae TaxID=2874970 RepID=A0AAV1T5I8_9STRA